MPIYFTDISFRTRQFRSSQNEKPRNSKTSFMWPDANSGSQTGKMEYWPQLKSGDINKMKLQHLRVITSNLTKVLPMVKYHRRYLRFHRKLINRNWTMIQCTCTESIIEVDTCMTSEMGMPQRTGAPDYKETEHLQTCHLGLPNTNSESDSETRQDVQQGTERRDSFCACPAESTYTQTIGT